MLCTEVMPHQLSHVCAFALAYTDSLTLQLLSTFFLYTLLNFHLFLQATAPSKSSFALAYTDGLTLQPIRHKLRNWRDDYTTVRNLLTAFRPANPPSLPEQPPPAGANTFTLGSLNNSHLGIPAALARSYEHCAAEGVTCNGAGRVVLLNLSQAALGGEPVAAVQADKAVGLALELPWLVAASWRGLPVQGRLPHLAELDASMPLVRSLCFGFPPLLRLNFVGMTSSAVIQ
jgi:hypothetical protein